MPLPFKKFFIKYIEQWTKTFFKKTGRPGRSETGWPAGQPAMILKFTGRVEKILTGSISDLDVLIDDNLNWKQQIKEQCSKVARGSWALNQLKHFVDEQTFRSVYHCLIYSHLQYCISSWGTASKSTLPPLFILQKRSIRLLTWSGYREHTNPLFYRAKCLKLKDIYSLETAKLMYKIHNNVLFFCKFRWV